MRVERLRKYIPELVRALYNCDKRLTSFPFAPPLVKLLQRSIVMLRINFGVSRASGPRYRESKWRGSFISEYEKEKKAALMQLRKKCFLRRCAGSRRRTRCFRPLRLWRTLLTYLMILLQPLRAYMNISTHASIQYAQSGRWRTFLDHV